MSDEATVPPCPAGSSSLNLVLFNYPGARAHLEAS